MKIYDLDEKIIKESTYVDGIKHGIEDLYEYFDGTRSEQNIYINGFETESKVYRHDGTLSLIKFSSKNPNTYIYNYYSRNGILYWTTRSTDKVIIESILIQGNKKTLLQIGNEFTYDELKNLEEYGALTKK